MFKITHTLTHNCTLKILTDTFYLIDYISMITVIYIYNYATNIIKFQTIQSKGNAETNFINELLKY